MQAAVSSQVSQSVHGQVDFSAVRVSLLVGGGHPAPFQKSSFFLNKKKEKNQTNKMPLAVVWCLFIRVSYPAYSTCASMRVTVSS